MWAFGAMAWGEMTLPDVRATLRAATSRSVNLSFWIDPAPRNDPLLAADQEAASFHLYGQAAALNRAASAADTVAPLIADTASVIGKLAQE